jgi:hypothetical protein
MANIYSSESGLDPDIAGFVGARVAADHVRFSVEYLYREIRRTDSCKRMLAFLRIVLD